MNDDSRYVQHILDCLAAIRSHTQGRPELFFGDRKTQKAVLRELHEVSESTQRLSPTLKAHHPHIPWPAISGFRNVIVHDYLELNLRRVWSVLHNDLGPLEEALKALAKNMGRTS